MMVDSGEDEWQRLHDVRLVPIQFNFISAKNSFLTNLKSRLLCAIAQSRSPSQGYQMVCFQTQNPKLGKFWRILLWKILVYFMTI
jgi:hypothetical protein